MSLLCVILLAFFPFAYIYAKTEPVAFSSWGVALRSGFCNPWAASILARWLA